jgi:hypothetical protein
MMVNPADPMKRVMPLFSVRFTMWGAVAGLAAGLGLLLYEAAVAPAAPGLWHAVICGVVGATAGFFIDTAGRGRH